MAQKKTTQKKSLECEATTTPLYSEGKRFFENLVIIGQYRENRFKDDLAQQKRATFNLPAEDFLRPDVYPNIAHVQEALEEIQGQLMQGLRKDDTQSLLRRMVQLSVYAAERFVCLGVK